MMDKEKYAEWLREEIEKTIQRMDVRIYAPHTNAHLLPVVEGLRADLRQLFEPSDLEEKIQAAIRKEDQRLVEILEGQPKLNWKQRRSGFYGLSARKKRRFRKRTKYFAA